jgi:diaminopimelate epimerase
MSGTPFTKVQSIGNDFVLIDLHAFGTDEELKAFVVKACERRFGVGSDGLLALGKAETPGELVLRMFNPDGTEDFCGNGLRCGARYAIDRGWVDREFTIRHLGRQVHVAADGKSVATTLGQASFAPNDVPLAAGSAELFEGSLDVAGERLIVSAVSTGSTHTVVFVDELPNDSRFFALSPLIEHHELFPARTSVIWTQVVSDRRLKLRIWERGVGETLGCGSGSSAAAVAHFRRLGRGGLVEVDNRGGTVTVSMADWRDAITITGEADEVYSGCVLGR